MKDPESKDPVEKLQEELEKADPEAWERIEQIVRTAEEEEKAAKRAGKWARHYVYLRMFQYACYFGMFGAALYLFKFASEFNFVTFLVVMAGLVFFWLSVSAEYSLRISFPEKYNRDNDDDGPPLE